MTARTEADLSEIKRKLLERRGELDHLSAADGDRRKPVELDQTAVGRLSRMDALQGQAMALESERRRAVERQRIGTALKRIEDGDYGYCVHCGDEIPARRLEMDPTTPVCVACAELGEHH